MAKKVEETMVDNTQDTEVQSNIFTELVKQEKPVVEETNGLISCLKNEKIIIKHIPKEGMVSNPKHLLYGGMSENSHRTFVVPKLTSGVFMNILTKQEKDYLENIMGLEHNALSVHKVQNNYWDDSNDVGISSVRLYKYDNRLNLADPKDYIRYKILLANKEVIAPSLQALQDTPKSTYQFVIINEGEETKVAKDRMSYKMKAYKAYWKVENDADMLRTIIEIIDGRPLSSTSKLDFLQTKVDALIEADSKLFYSIISDELLSTKVLIKKSIENGSVFVRGNYLYLKSDGSPLCEDNQEPTLNIAAMYLNTPKRQSIKFSLEAKLKE